MLIASNLTLIIKVFKNIQNPHTEQDFLGENDEEMNIFRIYEGFTLVNISDLFWEKKIRCGDPPITSILQFYQPFSAITDEGQA